MIRALREDDAEAYFELRREALLDAPLAFAASPADDVAASAQAVREQLRRAPEAVVLGAFEPRLIGAVGVVRDRHIKGSHKVMLWGMYVSPGHRRRGIAAALLQAAIDHARSLPGVSSVHLAVSSAAPAARRLYERAGFTSWGVELDALRHQGRAVVERHMTLCLDEPADRPVAGDPDRSAVADDALRMVPARRGHFLLESGHHGDLWLDLERLCVRPEPLRGCAEQLAARLAGLGVAAVCGPLVEGAFVALMVAQELGVPFTYSERLANAQAEGLFPVDYRLPRALHDTVRGQRVAIVNDVINAGSAVRGTFADLRSCGAEVIAIAALLVIGPAAARFAADQGLRLETLAALPNATWAPADCPLCASGAPLTDAS